MSCSETSKKLCGKRSCATCYERSFATHPRAAHWSAKNDLPPIQVHKSSNKMFYFDCTDCGHELYLPLNNITSKNGQWCRYCNKGNLCEADDCKFCFQNSFASHPMAVSWSPINEKTARQATKRSDDKFLFECVDCHHLFATALYSIKSDKVCPFCSNQRLCTDEDCSSCFKKSCASQKFIVDAWSSENKETPREVFLQSNRKYVFDCNVCHHSSTMGMNSYTGKGAPCGYCDHQKLCEKDDCVFCFNISFASHPKAPFWSPKNAVTPRQVAKGSEKRFLFQCEVCTSEFESFPGNVLVGHWCPFCKKKSEGKMQRALEVLYPSAIKTQRRFQWARFSKTNSVMPYDFEIIGFSKKILLELDGEQHFKQIANWGTPEQTQEKDIEKIRYAIENGYFLIHIDQLDVWYDRVNWIETLEEVIRRIEITDEPECIFMSSKADRYEAHLLGLDGRVPCHLVEMVKI